MMTGRLLWICAALSVMCFGCVGALLGVAFKPESIGQLAWAGVMFGFGLNAIINLPRINP
jgi:hypothetical protein